MNKQISLKKNHEIQTLISQRKSVGNKFYAIYYMFGDETKIAISISKKVCKAHDRNYNKRVIREIVRKNLEELKKLKCLIVIKEKSLTLNFEEKEREIKNLLKRIKVK